MTEVYDPTFYNAIRAGAQSSAASVLPFVVAELASIGVSVDSAVDVGCGEGWWGAELHRLTGADVLGVEGDHIAGHGTIQVIPADISQPGALQVLGDQPYTLALCLEVAEHLPPERADSLVAELCGLAPYILFSAAIPGQGGANHINEQWPGYWAERFQANGYHLSGSLRWHVWNDGAVEPWYRQNLMLAWSDEADACQEWWEDVPPLPVVHPDIFGWKL